MDITLNVFILAAILFCTFMAGFVLMGLLAAGGRASLEEEYRLNRCKDCDDDMIEDAA